MSCIRLLDSIATTKTQLQNFPCEKVCKLCCTEQCAKFVLLMYTCCVSILEYKRTPTGRITSFLTTFISIHKEEKSRPAGATTKNSISALTQFIYLAPSTTRRCVLRLKSHEG